MNTATSNTLELPYLRAEEQNIEDTTQKPATVPRLSDLSIKAIAANFKYMPILDKLPKQHVEQLMELLDIDLPLTLTVPLIEESVFWQRACKGRWSTLNFVTDYGGSWKRMYLERHLQEYLENLDPDDYIETEMISVLRLCAPYIRRIRLRQLVHSKKLVPRIIGGIPQIPQEGDPLSQDHINLKSVLSELPNLRELDIVFGMRNLGLELKPEYFMFSNQDCVNIGLGMMKLQFIKTLRIHRSLLDNSHLASVVQHLLFVQSLECIDFSNCLISDDGGLILGQLLRKHENITKLILINNKIGADGAHFLAYALTVTRCTLKLLNLRLNPIGDAGIAYLCSALAVSQATVELNVSGCGITVKGAKKLSKMLLYNKSLKVIDVSNNFIGEEGAKSILLALADNTKIVNFDMRMTGILSDQELLMSQYLSRNQHFHKF